MVAETTKHFIGYETEDEQYKWIPVNEAVYLCVNLDGVAGPFLDGCR